MTSSIDSNTTRQPVTREEIPPWSCRRREMRRTHVGSATSEQRDYYDRWWQEYANGKPPVLGVENVGYLWCHLVEVLGDFQKSRDLHRFLKAVEMAELAYPELADNHIRSHETLGELSGTTLTWRFQALLYLEDYDGAWQEWTEKPHYMGMFPAHAWNIRSRCRAVYPLVGSDIWGMVRNGSGLTKYGAEHKDEVLIVATRRLAEYREREGQDWLAGFFEQFDHDALTEEDFGLLRDLINDDAEFSRQHRTYELMRHYNTGEGSHLLFYGTGLDVRVGTMIHVSNIVSYAMDGRTRSFLRGCEDELRVSRGLPKIGEGWVTETDLFHKIHDAFPDEVIRQHGRPKWLGRQHLDIYFPETNIGVEYQGEQHLRPMEHLGGEERFLKQQQLDDRKRVLCKENGCELIEVEPGSLFDEVRTRIAQVLLDRSTKMLNKPTP